MFNYKHDAAVTDRGTKSNTACKSNEKGRNAIAAFHDIMVEETTKTYLDGSPSLNGLGNLEDAIFATNAAKESKGKSLTPGTRSGY